MISLLLHITGAEPVKVDVEELPKPGDISIVCKNPRERSDKEASWLDDGVTTIIYPWHSINFIQVLPSPDDEIEFPLPFRDRD
jgi:hypothetical protein